MGGRKVAITGGLLAGAAALLAGYLFVQNKDVLEARMLAYEAVRSSDMPEREQKIDELGELYATNPPRFESVYFTALDQLSKKKIPSLDACKYLITAAVRQHNRNAFFKTVEYHATVDHTDSRTSSYCIEKTLHCVEKFTPAELAPQTQRERELLLSLQEQVLAKFKNTTIKYPSADDAKKMYGYLSKALGEPAGK